MIVKVLYLEKNIFNVYLVSKWFSSMLVSDMQKVCNTMEQKTVVQKTVQRRMFKIIIIGDSNVGKTCLSFRFCSGRFPEKSEATIGVDFREKTLEVDNETVKVKILQIYHTL